LEYGLCLNRGKGIVAELLWGGGGVGEETLSVDTVDTGDKWNTVQVAARWPVVGRCPEALTWLRLQADLGLAPRTLEAYGRALADYLTVCAREGIAPLTAGQAEIARYVRDLARRPNPRGARIIALDSGVGLANATLQQRLVVVRLFYDYLVEEGRRETNPVGRGRYTPGHAFGGQRARRLLPRFTRLPWIPTDAQWQQLLSVARTESLRTRLMLALAYDAGLRREELCLLRTEDIDPAHRTLRIRAETTKNRLARVVPYSAATGVLFQAYLHQRRALSAARGLLFLSESRRNRAAPITLWTWSKVVRALALRAGVPQFSTHTPRHLCLTDLARSGWELHAIARFAGHRSVATTLQYIHLSGRDLAAQLARGMAQVHAWRRRALAALCDAEPEPAP
jgi:site-specific recombinase XerD